MNDKRASRNKYSPHEVAVILDQLISAWYERQDAQRALAEFEAETLAPDPPQKFDNVAQLTDYKNEELRYQKRLDELTDRWESSYRLFETAVERAEKVFPAGGPPVYVFHDHHASDPQRSGKYRITHQRNLPEGPIAIVKMDH